MRGCHFLPLPDMICISQLLVMPPQRISLHPQLLIPCPSVFWELGHPLIWCAEIYFQVTGRRTGAKRE